MGLFNRRKKKSNNKAKQQQGTAKPVTTAKNVQVGDIVKVGVPIRITSVSTASGTFHDVLNRGQRVINFEFKVDAGVFQGMGCSMQCTETDRIEIIAITKPTWKRRVQMYLAKVYDFLFAQEDDKNSDKAS